MKITTRSSSTPRRHPRSACEAKALENSYKSLNNHSPFLLETNHNHYSRRGTCPVVLLGGKYKDTFKRDEEYISFKTTTQGVTDSRKNQQFRNTREDWKILTLQEIRLKREPRVMGGESSSTIRSKSKQKIFVSISKSHRSSSQSRSKQSSEPKLFQMNGSHKALDTLSSRGRIVQAIELQLEEDKGKKTFLC